MKKIPHIFSSLKLSLILGLLLILSACIPTDQAQTNPSPTLTISNSTPETQTPTTTAQPTMTPTFTPFPTSPVTPSPSVTEPPFPTRTPLPEVDFPAQMSNDVEAWYLYEARNGRFRFSFPPAANVTAYADDCVRLTLYGAGLMQIYTTPPFPASSCQPLASTAYDGRERSKMIAINQQQVLVNGLELLADSDVVGEIYRLQLDDELILEYAIQPDIFSEEHPTVIRTVLEEIVASLRLPNPLVAEVTPTAVPLVCFASAVDPAPPAGLLRVTFEKAGQRWLWREETGEAVASEPLPTPPTVPDGIFEYAATDSQVAYLRPIDIYTDELWVSDLNGQNGRLLTTISAPDISDHYEWATRVGVSFRWLSDGRRLLVSLWPDADGLGESPLRTVWLLDAETGERQELLHDEADFYKVQESPNGRYLIALLPNEVRFIELETAETISVELPQTVYGIDNPLHFSPDDQQLLLFVDEQLALIDLNSFAVQLTPLPYNPIGASHYVVYPPIHWHPDGDRFLTTTVDQQNATFNDVFAEAATFSVWEVALADFSARFINRFEGNAFMTSISPTQQHLTTMRQHMSNERWLYLAELQTGEMALYDQGLSIQFKGWSPDGSRFAYQKRDATPQVGQLCQPPQPLSSLATRDDHPFRWTDSGRFLYFEGSPETNESNTLYLIGLDGSRAAVAQLDTSFAKFDFYFE